MQRDWIDYASAAGSIATAFTLFYLVIKEWKTRKHITDLGIIAKELQEQNELQKLVMKFNAKPDLVMGGTSMVGTTRAITVSIKNSGHIAFISKYEYVGDLDFDPCYTTILDTGKNLSLTGRPQGIKSLDDCNYLILIRFSDTYGNKYIATANGHGFNISPLEIQDV